MADLFCPKCGEPVHGHLERHQQSQTCHAIHIARKGDGIAEKPTEWVIVVREPWLSMLRGGRKLVECRVGATRPHPASKTKVGDIVHLRGVSQPPSFCMRVTRVLNLGLCTRRNLKPIATAYHEAMGGEPVKGDASKFHPYLCDRDSGYPTLVWLADPADTDLKEFPRYIPWARARREYKGMAYVASELLTAPRLNL